EKQIFYYDSEVKTLYIPFYLFREDENHRASTKLLNMIAKKFASTVMQSVLNANSWVHAEDKASLLNRTQERITSQMERIMRDERTELNHIEGQIQESMRVLKQRHDRAIIIRNNLDTGTKRIDGIKEKLVKEIDMVAAH